MTSKILLVDDNAQFRRLVRWILSLDTQAHDAYEFQEASSGEQALKVAYSWRPDLAILDLYMPGEPEGHLLCEYLSRSDETAGIKLVMISASEEQTDIDKARIAGAHAYMTKPIKPVRLRRLVSHLLSGRGTEMGRPS